MKNDPLEILITDKKEINLGRDLTSREFLIALSVEWNAKRITADDFMWHFWNENKTACLKEWNRQIQLEEAEKKVKKLSRDFPRPIGESA